jgi:hypothetical protein
VVAATSWADDDSDADADVDADADADTDVDVDGSGDEVDVSDAACTAVDVVVDVELIMATIGEDAVVGVSGMADVSVLTGS